MPLRFFPEVLWSYGYGHACTTTSTPPMVARNQRPTPPPLSFRNGFANPPPVASAVCSLCTRQGLPGHVVCDVIQHTLEAGNSGPAVSLWVVHCLLRMVQADCKLNKDDNAVSQDEIVAKANVLACLPA